ncbi:hypothetical protein SFUMM280S_07129 [Streptomyces fumanus]
MLRYFTAAVVDAGRVRSSRTVKVTWAVRRSTTRTSVTSPTSTPEMRTLSPSVTPVASVNSAL